MPRANATSGEWSFSLPFIGVLLHVVRIRLHGGTFHNLGVFTATSSLREVSFGQRNDVRGLTPALELVGVVDVVPAGEHSRVRPLAASSGICVPIVELIAQISWL